MRLCRLPSLELHLGPSGDELHWQTFRISSDLDYDDDDRGDHWKRRKHDWKHHVHQQILEPRELVPRTPQVIGAAVPHHILNPPNGTIARCLGCVGHELIQTQHVQFVPKSWKRSWKLVERRWMEFVGDCEWVMDFKISTSGMKLHCDLLFGGFVWIFQGEFVILCWWNLLDNRSICLSKAGSGIPSWSQDMRAEYLLR